MVAHRPLAIYSLIRTATLGERVSDIITRPWHRCVRTLDVSERLRSERVENHVLRERCESHAWLRRMAEPELDGLAESVGECGSVVLLADADGLILDAVGSLEFLHKAERVALQPGVYWTEARSSTNAIGTALAERQPMEMRGREH